MEEAGVGRCEIDFTVIHGGGSNNPRAFVGKGPDLFASGCLERVKLRIAAAEVDDAVGDRRGGLDALLIVGVGVFTCFEAPLFLAGGGVESIEVAVPTADEESAVGKGWRCVNDVARFEFPLQ